MNLLSAEVDVGKSSKEANSVPSPKLRLLVGRVSVRFAGPPVVASVQVSSRLRRIWSGRAGRDSREMVPCEPKTSLALSELVRRDER